MNKLNIEKSEKTPETEKLKLSEKEQTEKKLFGIALNEKEEIGIIIKNQTFWQKLRGIKERKYLVNKFTNMYQNQQIAQLYVQIPPIDFDKSNSEIFQQNINIIAEHGYKIAQIIGILLYEKNIKFIMTNLDNKDGFQIMSILFEFIDYQSFMSTIALVRNSVSLENQ